jgi:large exoprotein involved in heme utilization and adhesion
MVLRSRHPVGGDAHFWSGGSFRIEQLDGSLGNLFSLHDPIIRSLGDVSLSVYQGASLHILAGGSVNLGTAIVTSPDTTGEIINPKATPTLAKVTLSDGTSLVIDGSARPTLDVRAGMNPAAIGNPLGISGNNFTLFFPPPANNPVATSADITVGDVVINPSNGLVLLTNQYAPNQSLTGGNITVDGKNGINAPGFGGNGGDIILDARGNIAIASQVNTVASGNGGNITLLANDNIILNPGSLIQSSGALAGNITLKSNADITGTRSAILSNSLNLGQGNAGDLTINAKDRVSFDGLGTLISAFGMGTGSSGDINIQARSLSLTNGAQVYSTILGQTGATQSKAGDIQVQVADSLSVTGGSQLATQAIAQGKAGDVIIEAGDRVSFDGAILIKLADLPKNFPNPDARNFIQQFVDLVFGQVVDPNTIIPWSSGITTRLFSGNGQGGDITITAQSLSLTNNAELNTSIFGIGNAGNIRIQATDTVSLDKSFILSRGGQQAIGNSGNIDIDATSLFQSKGAELSSFNFGQGNAGNITINAIDWVALDGLGTLVATFALGTGKSGNINIQARSLSMTNGAQVYSTVFRPTEVAELATAGNIQVKVSDSVFVSGGSQFVTQAIGRGKAGDVIIEAGGQVTFDGEIFIEIDDLPKIFLHQDTRDFIQSFVDGVLRPVLENSDFDPLLPSIFNLPLPSGIIARLFSLPPNFIGKGESGKIRINANSLLVTNDAELNTSSFGIGDAGDIIIRVKDTVTFDGEGSSAFSNAQSFRNLGFEGQGNGGNIEIQARSLFLTDAADILASTGGKGDAGTITVHTTDSVVISGVASYPFDKDGQIGGYSAGLFTDISRVATGGGGSVTVTTDKLEIFDGGAISTRTLSDRQGGSITINANSILLGDGGQIVATTQGSGDAGDITVNVTDKIEMTGSDPLFFDRLNSLRKTFGEERAIGTQNPLSPESGIFANTTSGSTGNGGSIFITHPRQIILADKAKVAVNSQGQGDGGTLFIQTDSLTLDQEASISAATASGEGGNIALQVGNILLLRDHSLISTQAGGTGNGGNIDINAKFIIAVPEENSDISANAFEGKGGNINITTQGIFGIEFRERSTSLSDITASSEFGLAGTVAITTPDVDLGKGLVDLPETFQAPLLASGCRTQGTQTASSFVNVGRGGLPPNPNETRSSDAIWHDMRPISVSRGQRAVISYQLPVISYQLSVISELITNHQSPSHQSLFTNRQSPVTFSPITLDQSPITLHQSPITLHQLPIIEAQGWVISPNGQIILTAQASNVTPHSSGTIPVSCQAN